MALSHRSLDRTFNFNTFGGESQASSRLRAWRLAERLRELGHDVTVNGSELANIEVFQKQRNLRRAEQATKAGATVVFDFDDNYLLDEAGTRHDVLRMMLRADLVTVGSAALLAEVARYHDATYLFENPLDVADPHAMRPDGAWEGRLVWFGNRTNLVALEALGLPERVTTITQRGDVEWALETVDAELVGHDLALIPVVATDWTLSKNANRLLKCVGLGLPFLASQTPEHVRTAHQVGLSDRLLVGEDDDWHGRIAEIAADYDRALAEVRAGRARAWELFGVPAQAEQWLDQVMRADIARRERRRAQVALPESVTAAIADIDVVVFNENEPDWADSTTKALRGEHARFRSARVVQVGAQAPALAPAWETTLVAGDFFDLYGAMAQALQEASAPRVLLLRAGAEPHRGFFEELAAFPDDVVVLFTGEPLDSGTTAAPAPTELRDLILGPHRYDAVLMPSRLLADLGGPDPGHRHFGVWSMLLRWTAHHDVRMVACAAPVLGIAEKVRRRGIIDSYQLFLTTADPAAAADLPGLAAETLRFEQEIDTAVVEDLRDLYAEWMPAVVPTLRREIAMLRRAQEDLDAKLETLRERRNHLQSEYHRLKERNQEVLRAYEKRKRQGQAATAELDTALAEVERLRAALAAAARNGAGAAAEDHDRLRAELQKERERRRELEAAYVKRRTSQQQALALLAEYRELFGEL